MSTLSEVEIGKVILVGAGPGDPGLITVHGREAIQRADVVVYDHLVSKELVDLTPAQASRIYVGKKSGKHTLGQDEINALLAQEAEKGQIVVRLKGGDPFVFGRGAEECKYLHDHAIHFEVIPGISAAAAVPAYAGIPVTCRNLSTSFIAVTGHEQDTKIASNVDWSNLSRMTGTIVIFMGVLKVREIAATMIQNGKSPQTPAAIIRWGTYPHQKTLVGTLESIADQVNEAHMRPPALIVVGDVVRLREHLNWFESRPLFGRNIVIPRARIQKSRLASFLKERGAKVIEIPIVGHGTLFAANSLSETVKNIEGYDWIVFCGTESVKQFFADMVENGRDSRRLSHCRIAAMDQETADQLLEHGILPDFVSSHYCSAIMVEELSNQFPLEKSRIFIPGEREVPEKLIQEFQHIGAKVEYTHGITSQDNVNISDILNGQRVDLIAFTCSSTIKSLVERYGVQEVKSIANEATIASIGPRTTEMLENLGLPVHIQSDRPNILEFADEIVSFYRNDSDKD